LEVGHTNGYAGAQRKTLTCCS